MTDEYRELEFKYNANGVKLQDFITMAENLNPEKRLDISSWDYYYTGNIKEQFMRYRESDGAELTIKRKVVNANNWERVEVDLPIDSKRVTRKLIDNWVGLEGYKENFRIFKSCFIFWIGQVNIVYYTVYDENMKEQGRFIEIEVNKSEVPKLGVENAFKKLKELEQTLSILGITPQHRLKKSLFEMFVKGQ